MMRNSALVLLPGLLCDAELWAAQVDALGDIAAITVPDLTLDDAVDAMARRVLAEAPDTFALAALSMGGYVAFEILRQAPERVTRLALIDTSAAPDDAARAAQRRGAIASLELGQFLGVSQRMLPQLVHARHVDGPVGDRVRRMAERVGRDAFIRQQRAILSRPDSRPLLPRIAVPTLVAVGDGDRLTPPSESRSMHGAIAQARFHLFERCGHLPPLESPEETSAVLRAWLDDAHR